MIWNIFRKDLRLLWPMAVVVGLVQCLTAAVLSFPGELERAAGGGGGQYGWLSNDVLPAICLLGLVLLTLTVVQQDRFPGSTQDWLTRPIPRGQLLAAKMVFILVVVLGPVFFSDVYSGLAEHLPWLEVLAASLTRVVMLFCIVCLPALLLGIVTRSLTEALVFSLGVGLVVATEMITLSQLEVMAPLAGSGFAWTILLVLLFMNLAAVAVLLPLQVRWRATNRVRWIAVGYLCVAPAVIFLPWSAGFGLHGVLTGSGQQSSLVVRAGSTRKANFTRSAHRDSSQVTLSLPVSVSAPGPDELWQLDEGEVQLLDRVSGNELAVARAFLTGDPSSEDAYAERLLASVPPDLFRAAQAKHAMLRAAMFMTTFRLVSSQPAVGLSRGSVDAYSRCRPGSGVVARCVSTRPVATCVEIEGPKEASRRLWPGSDCRSTSYAPWPLSLWRDPYYTFVLPPLNVATIRLGREVSPAGSDEQKDVRVLRNYAPNAHFVRTVEFALDEATDGPGKRGARSRDGVGTSARFASPAGMTADSHGNVFIVDQADSVVRRVAASGEVTTIAGQAGLTGRSDGQGSDARFDHPGGIAIDTQGNLYVADTGNALVRRISPSGAVTTIAGGERSKSSTSGGPSLTHPTGVVFTHDGSLYVTDYNEVRGAVILKVLPGGELKAVAGPDPTSTPEVRLPERYWIE